MHARRIRVCPRARAYVVACTYIGNMRDFKRSSTRFSHCPSNQVQLDPLTIIASLSVTRLHVRTTRVSLVIPHESRGKRDSRFLQRGSIRGDSIFPLVANATVRRNIISRVDTSARALDRCSEHAALSRFLHRYRSSDFR